MIVLFLLHTTGELMILLALMVIMVVISNVRIHAHVRHVHRVLCRMYNTYSIRRINKTAIFCRFCSAVLLLGQHCAL